MATDYEKQSYWHDRFASETSFEWLVTSKHHILHLGSGTSDLHNHFRSRGLLNVTNLDFEPLAAERGRDLEQNAFGDVRMNYVVADATRLVDEPIMIGSHGGAAGKEEQIVTPAKFDLVVDKSTADAVAFLELPFHVEVMAKVPTRKVKPTDPDIYHWCFILRPM
ncbi:unnamed protein product [Clonostachys rosea f. rosea IK726]|uniref:Uncharacterized protein n=1 Tax=Clonostachys rosea f. rosea IK726 TaxID=1349383 RepID=A0ACA9U1X6_BIOOC|nr:unnamed protein product [Clonostachys rosea f. rosea IK726]